MTKKQKKVLYRIIIAAVLMAVLHFVPVKGYLRCALYLVPYFIIGYDILRKAALGIAHREIFDENFLMAVATVGAMVLGVYQEATGGEGEFAEGVAVMLFYQIGELFQAVAVGKSRRNITALMDIRPDYANIEDEDGNLEQVDPDEVEAGTGMVVRPGSGGNFQHEEGAHGELYHQVCQILHTGGLLQCPGAGDCSVRH